MVRDVYDEKENKSCDPAPQTEVEDVATQDVTLESELWTFDEVAWHETAQDTTTIKYVFVRQIARTSRQSCHGRDWTPAGACLETPLDKMLFRTSDAKRANDTSLTKAIRTRIVQIEAGNALEWTGGCRLVGQGHHHTSLHTPRTDAQAQSLSLFFLTWCTFVCVILFACTLAHVVAVRMMTRSDLSLCRPSSTFAALPSEGPWQELSWRTAVVNNATTFVSSPGMTVTGVFVAKDPEH